MNREFLLALLVFCLLPDTQGQALRCANGLVDVGDRKAEVLARCGDPATTTLVAVEKTLTASDGTVASEMPVERWSYDFGPQAFQQILTFRGDLLTRIETGSRGSEPSGGSGRLLAAVGDTMAEVRQKNGEPFFEELVGSEATVSPKAGQGGQVATRVEVPVDRWTYRFGPGRFMQVLTFKGGRLVQIESGARE